jgi:hypothetical protein
LALDCHGLAIQFAGQKLTVALDKIASASNRGAIMITPGGAEDRLTGTVSIVDGAVSITTHDLGRVTLPASVFKCPDRKLAKLNATALAADAEPAQGRDNAAIGKPPLSRLSDGKMIRVTGTGGASPRLAQVSQATAATTSGDAGAAAAQNVPAADKAPVADQKAPAADQNAPKNAGGTPSPPPPSETPKEQQENTERNSLEFLRSEAVLVRPRKIEGDFGINYIHTSQAIGNIRALSANATFRIGIIDRLEGFAGIPMLWGQRQLQTPNSVITSELTGVGDVKFGLKYNTINEGPDRPALVTGLTVSAPSGRTPYFNPTGTIDRAQFVDTRNPNVPQIGTGHWIFTPAITAIKSYDPVVLFGTLSYSHWLPAKFFGTLVEPGDVWEVNSGLGFAVNETDTLAGQVFVDYAQPWKFTGHRVSQTGITPISFKLGYTHVLSPADLINPTVIWGLSRDANDVVVALDWIHRF